MAGKKDKPEDVVLKLRRVEVLQGQGMRLQMRCGRSALPFRSITAGASSMAV